ncbi:F-box/LRR-repeat protein 6 [Betta splendens]|uniref:F-box/LRR-repeat protein 6 n=1 Tax=Betta splendens TaxID=158456 RepID=A0A6P7NR45_BETSP|nr:F-box/LRR-repeat protein 6 [Betta splendens]XP_029022370.1 F-box/LRR-repeat protein 6 [Betta splendens]XP_029022371.1 F-box/LRR-repeat protein 6 [Betta splendens]
MDSTKAEASSPSKRQEDIAPSTSGASSKGESRLSKKSSLKRRRGEQKNAKAKKRKKARVARSSQVGYTVHQGEDMLLVISSTTSHYSDSAWTLQKKGRKKKSLSKGKLKAKHSNKKKAVPAKSRSENNAIVKTAEETTVFVPQKTADNRWGVSVPEEVLSNIFQMVVVQDGAVPFLCRVGRVCRLWNAAASSPVLWRKVTISHCWIAPGKKQLPTTQHKIKDTINWLAQSRFSQLREFSLCHWKDNVNYAVEMVSHLCPHLRSLSLSYCTGLTTRAFDSLGLHSRSLQSINLQYSEFQVEGLLEYLENHGSQIKQIWFTQGLKNDRLLATISRGHCPHLELLEVNTKLDSKDCELSVCIQALQMACPKLKTFRMLNVRPLHKSMRNAADSASGFPLLEELCIATTSYSYMTDKDLWDILFNSTKLRVLDLRGCSRITPSGLASIPCLELECLFWGLYFSSHIGSSSPKKGLHMVTHKWNQTLQQLDVANQLFTEEDLEIAMSFLAQAKEADTLRSLNLSGTRITPPALRSVIGHTTALTYLNLSSCRYLPRGVKRIYRGQEEIHQLLDILN